MSISEIILDVRAAAAVEDEVDIWTTETVAQEVVVRDGAVERYGSSAYETVTTDLFAPEGTGVVTTHGPADGAAIVRAARVVARLTGAQTSPVLAAGTAVAQESILCEHFDPATLAQLSRAYPTAGGGVHVEIRARTEHRVVAAALAAGGARSYATSLAEAVCRVTMREPRRVQLTQDYFGRSSAGVTAVLQRGMLATQIEHATMLATLPDLSGLVIDRVLLHSRISARLITLAMPSFSADAVEQERSRLAHLLGKPVAAPSVSLVEHAAAEEAPLPRPWDDAGTLVYQATLVRCGILERYLSSARTARISPVTATTWRGEAGETPAIGVGHVACSVGGEPERFEEMQRSGQLHLVQANGLHMSNDVTGDFSFTGSGISVTSDGKLGVIRDVPIAGNVFQVLRDIDGHDGHSATWRSDHSFVTAPGLWVRSLTVGAAR